MRQILRGIVAEMWQLLAYQQPNHGHQWFSFVARRGRDVITPSLSTLRSATIFNPTHGVRFSHF